MCSAIGSGRSIKVCERFGLDGARLLYSDRDSCNNKVESGMLRYSELSYKKRDPEQGQGREMTLAFSDGIGLQADMQKKGGKPARLLRAVQVV